jgi:hypothetical protein
MGRAQTTQNSRSDGLRFTHNVQSIEAMLVKVIDQHDVAG